MIYPKQVKILQDIPEVYLKYKEELAKKETGLLGFFRKWHIKRQLVKFKHKDKALRAGARGEISVMNQLEKLTNQYHLFCNVYIRLPYYIRYKGQKPVICSN